MTDLLDYGYLKLIEHWGSDESIISAARMSTSKSFQGWGPFEEDDLICNGTGYIQTNPNLTPINCPNCRGTGKKPGDEKLLRFMWEHDHGTPFEMAGFTIEAKAPIMVFREWHRHRVPFGYNEMSARYVPLPNENYAPKIARIIEGATKAGKNKQAQSVGGHVATEQNAIEGLEVLDAAYQISQKAYERLLKLGWPKELARLPVPVGRYSVMRATSNLRGWLGFMKLRCAPDAQYEIRVYANEVANVVQSLFPRTHELWTEGQK